ncbi:ribosome-binding factor A, partial [Chloroflexota bacterium]
MCWNSSAVRNPAEYCPSVVLEFISARGAVLTRRIERLNTFIRQEISELLRYQVKDPRLGNALTVTEVVTSPDMRYARVFVSCLGSD